MAINIYSQIKNYLIDSYRELKKVTWPSKKETTSHTMLIISISLGMAVFLGGLDYFFTWFIERFIK
ncbi:preprotein translocase subunit SecE [Candidatus Falkowbacteria bacterium RIFOXYB2_FULL_38_15]|uniref:Protein translocase subunit SecE n=1 Tax=Candidatus Falkowbacteria bacterium RIFOXYA2_FULL_38_12 TaxID=1797993 RepID=A0A1F5S467_9BACT|nr:MAG: preprotein translocase subunit SecE [Candidatus Falkowbacteria bacterium RIFOXYA2_FULL_38_12]OGF32470.1 MAG: preprotein translocase subunit SecE [Candidatus Falkowbacteria bacterium RIFOXYB2_FULL_38_15]OGF42429.1 MAG: preprotein translocase subunit SecE [Candidatus Falkowbacteria bacterium RIFOXYD2_FULL_39_16]